MWHPKKIIQMDVFTGQKQIQRYRKQNYRNQRGTGGEG